MERKQLHVWLADDDYEFLVRYASERDESLGAVTRRLIRAFRKNVADAPSKDRATPRARTDIAYRS